MRKKRKMKLKDWAQKITKTAFWRRHWKIASLVGGGLFIIILFGVLLVGGQRDVGLSEAGAQIAELAQNIRAHYKMRPDFWGLSTQEVIAKKIYPSMMTTDGTTLKGYFANIVEVGADENGTAVMPTARTFVIAYKGLTEQQCVGVATAKFGHNFWLTISGMEIISDKGRQMFNWSNTDFMLPASKGIVKKLCGNRNMLVFYFE